MCHIAENTRNIPVCNERKLLIICTSWWWFPAISLSPAAGWFPAGPSSQPGGWCCSFWGGRHQTAPRSRCSETLQRVCAASSHSSSDWTTDTDIWVTNEEEQDQHGRVTCSGCWDMVLHRHNLRFSVKRWRSSRVLLCEWPGWMEPRL